jgi:PAS domain S-box-containing protein
MPSPSDIQALFQALPDLYFRLAGDGRIRDCRGGAPSELLVPRERLIGKHFHAVPEPEARRDLAEAVAQVRLTRVPVRVEYAITIGGRPSFFEARLLPAPEGELIAVVRNISDLQEAVEELARQRAFLRQVIDVNPNFVFAKNRAGQFTLVNQAVADAYGSTVEDLLGKTDADFNSNAEEVRQFRADDLEVLDTLREKVIAEEPITDAAGRVRWLQTIKRPLISADGTAGQILGVATDISMRRELEDQLRQAQKIEAIGLLAGGIAHDFNNLLTVILGFTEVMLMRLRKDDPARQDAEEILKASDRAAALTRQLLAFGRKQVLDPKVLDLREVVCNVERLLRRVIGEHIELETAHDEGLGCVKADPSQVEQVIMNLAVNARDAMPGGGRLVIGTANVELERASREHPGLAPGRYVLLTVADNGPGMDQATKERIFEPFFTTKEMGKGTGLGLSTVHGIVKQSGGGIEVSSEPGRGTTFRIYLPRVEQAPETARRPGIADGAATGTETVLIVEDEPVVRSLARYVLEERGYRILEAADGDEALHLCRTSPGSIDLVISDVIMPRLSGPDLFRKLADVRPGLTVLYMSGYAETGIVRDGILAPGTLFIPKPFSPAALAAKVREALDLGRAGAEPASAAHAQPVPALAAR